MSEIRITGLEATSYLINNDIFVEIKNDGFNGIEAVDISFFDIENNKQYQSIRLYAGPSRIIKVNISPALKAYFSNAQHNTNYTSLEPIPLNSNWHRFDIIFSVRINNVNIVREIKNKIFIRGGKRTNESNIFIESKKSLSPCDKIPAWDSLPVAEYVQSDTFGILKKNRNLIAPNKIDKQPSFGCNPVYIKFLNSLGGYSYWLFEVSESEQTNDNIGVINNLGKTTDLGNVLDFKLNVESTVPDNYLPLMLDLASSSEIYMYISDSQKWERITSDNNSIKDITGKRFHTIKLKFKMNYNFRPQLTW